MGHCLAVPNHFFLSFIFEAKKKVANKAGLEPATSRFVVGRSIQLSYMSRNFLDVVCRLVKDHDFRGQTRNL